MTEDRISSLFNNFILNSTKTIFEIVNLFQLESQIEKNILDNRQTSLPKFNEKFSIFELKDLQYLDQKHETFLLKYKTLPGNEDFNYVDLQDRRRNLLKDVNNFYNYVPEMCDNIEHLTAKSN